MLDRLILSKRMNNQRISETMKEIETKIKQSF